MAEKTIDVTVVKGNVFKDGTSHTPTENPYLKLPTSEANRLEKMGRIKKGIIEVKTPAEPSDPTQGSNGGSEALVDTTSE